MPYYHYNSSTHFMTTLEIIFGIALLLVLLAVGYLILKTKAPQSSEELKDLLKENLSLKAETERLNRDIGEFAKVKQELSEKTGELIRIEKQLEGLNSKNEQYLERLKNAGKKISDLEARDEQRDKEKTQSIADALKIRDSFEEQKKRLIEKEEAKQEKAKNDRNRIWNDHEQQTVATLKEVCRKSEIDFPTFDNNALPESFDGKFKPDFLVEFLGQYIVFDAKVNDPDSNNSLQSYLKNQVKSTAEKIKKSSNAEEIYNVVYLVVPSLALNELTQFYFVEQGVHFYIISEESIQPILATFKKVTYYENIDHIDPREREKIIDVIAGLDYELSYQNAVNVLLTARSIKTLGDTQLLDDEMQTEILQAKSKKRLINFTPTDLKRLVNHPEEQIAEIKKLIGNKKPPVGDDDIDDVQKSLL